MTREDWNKISPDKTILDVETDNARNNLRHCNTENFDGYWLCCTEDLTNPYPNEVTDDDWDVYKNNAEVIKF